MKKFLTILILGLLTCNISFADNLKIVDGDTIVLNGEKIRFSVHHQCTKELKKH